jgi:tetratricopeptide (TPR) repeat protein
MFHVKHRCDRCGAEGRTPCAPPTLPALPFLCRAPWPTAPAWSSVGPESAVKGGGGAEKLIDATWPRSGCCRQWHVPVGRLCKASHRLLAAVAGLDERLLDGALRAAVAGQLLVTRAGGDGYQFRHALLWEVVEAGLLPGERARLHAGYAHALSERPELAAERARGFAEAHAHYQRALALWEQVGDPGRSAGLDRVELLVRAAEAAAFTGQVARAVGLLEDALGRVDLSAEPVRAAVLLARLGEDRRVAGDEAGALAAFSQAEGLVEGAPPSADRAGVLAACAYGLFLSMRSEQAIACAEEAVAAARAVGARAEKAKALRVLAAGLANVGGLDQAVGLVLGARRIAEEVGDAEAVVATYRTACKLLMWAGRARDALQDLQRGYQRAHELGMERADGSFVAGNLAFTLLDTGGWVECERLTREPLVSDTWGAFNLRVCRGMLLARRGEFAAAREQLDLAAAQPAVHERVGVGGAGRVRIVGGPRGRGGRGGRRGAGLVGRA